VAPGVKCLFNAISYYFNSMIKKAAKKIKQSTNLETSNFEILFDLAAE